MANNDKDQAGEVVSPGMRFAPHLLTESSQRKQTHLSTEVMSGGDLANYKAP